MILQADSRGGESGAVAVGGGERSRYWKERVGGVDHRVVHEHEGSPADRGDGEHREPAVDEDVADAEPVAQVDDEPGVV